MTGVVKLFLPSSWQALIGVRASMHRRLDRDHTLRERNAAVYEATFHVG